MFKKAIRKSVKLKLGITGPSGSGKSFSALRLAKGLGKKIAVIDAENGSASLYSDQFDFDVANITPPFTTEKYIDAINSAEKSGYDVIIVDSLTHSWDGEGGLLQQKAALDARPGSNHWTNWGPIDKKYKALNDALLHSSCHIICTFRSKMEYVQSEDGGKKKVQKVGMAPIYREGMSYELSIVFDIAMNHEAEVSKDRTGLFVDKIFKITEETGEIINAWINSGAKEESKETKTNEPAPSAEVKVENNGDGKQISKTDSEEIHRSDEIKPPRNETPITISMAKNVYDLLEARKKQVGPFHDYLKKTYNVEMANSLKFWQYEEVIKMLSGAK